MEGSSGSSDQQQQVQVAPFVAKTYQMVSDPRMDSLVRWGRDNNSFLVLEPVEFSRRLLPFYFKHNNFSSFIRQLNTYGFRKVDFDKWEFAHECFLRGQIHLLPSIIRRKTKSNNPAGGSGGDKVEAGGDEEQVLLLTELGRLRREQRSLDEELRTVSERLQATEGKSQQMLAFLARVVEDPGLLPRLMLAKNERRRQQLTEKRRRLLIPAPCWPSPPLPYCDPPPSPTNGDNGLYRFGALLTANPMDYSAQAEPENAASTVVDGVPFTTFPQFGGIMNSAMAVGGAPQTPFRPATTTAERGTNRAVAGGAAHPFFLLGQGYY